MRLAFRPLVQSAIDARRQILREFSQVPKEIVAAMAGLGRAQGGAFRGATAEARAAYKEQIAIARQAAKDQAAAAQAGARMEASLERERVAEARRAERDIRQERARTARESARAEREAARAHRAASAEVMANRRRYAQMTSYNATRFLTPHVPILSLGRRAAAEAVRGFGIDPTLSGAMQRNIQFETLVQQASNSAMLAGQNFSPQEIATRIRDVSNRRGVSRQDAASAALSYQKLTGDMGGGLDAMDSIVARATATGTSVDDFAQAMANASNALGDMPNKGKVLLDIMDQVTVQGAKGAVEVSDLATHMARVASTAGAFDGDPARNIKLMGAFTQLAREGGGAPSPAEAARSVVGFGNTFQKSARLGAFESITGKSAFADKGRTQLRDPVELIKDALTATHGNREEMNKIFMDAIGARAVRLLTKTYNDAGGGAAGLGKVEDKVSHYMTGGGRVEAMMGQLNAQYEQTTAAKAQRFQNQLDDIALKIQGEVLPAFEKAAPMILKFVSAMGDLTAWALTNPIKALFAAIMFSVGRAVAETVARGFIEKGMMAAMGRLWGTGGGGGRGGGRGGGLLPLGAGGPIGVGLALGGVTAAAIAGGAIDSHVSAESDIDRWGKTTADLMAAGADPKKVDNKKREELRRKVLDKQMELAELERTATIGASAGGVFGEMKKGNFGGAWDAFSTNFGRMTGAGSWDMKHKSLIDSLANDQANLAALRANPYQEDKANLANYVAKDPSKTSEADLRAAFNRGGVPELEKIATLQTKQQTVGEQMLEQQKQQVVLLRNIEEKLPVAPAGGGGADHEEG